MLDQEVVADFIAEAREHLETIEPSLLELEKNPGKLDILNDIFRPMHSLKGASGFLNLTKINHLAHKSENVLDALRKGSLSNDADIMDVILSATDILRQMLDNLENHGDEGQVDVEPLVEQLDKYMQQEREAGQASSGHTESGPGDGAGMEGQEQSAGLADQPESYDLKVSSPEHLSDFLEEAREIVSNLNSCLLELERGGSDTQGLVQDAFRYFHNLKGNSGLIGHAELNAVTHEAESILNSFRSAEIIPDAPTVDGLLKAVDVLETLISAIDQDRGSVRPVDIQEILDRLQQISSQTGGSSGSLAAGGEAGAVVEAQSSGGPGASADQSFDPEDVQVFVQTVEQQLETIGTAMDSLARDDSETESIDALHRSLVGLQNACAYMEFEDLKVYAERTANLVDQARKAGQGFAMVLPIMEQEVDILKDMLASVLDGLKVPPGGAGDAPEAESRPPADAGDDGRGDAQGELEASGAEAPGGLKGPVAAEAAEPVCGDDRSGSKTAAAEATQDADPGAPPSSGGQAKAKTASTIRVDHEKLDHLMNLIGELIINRNRFALITKELEEGRETGEVVQHLAESTDAMARISNDLQDTIMQVRMVPVRSVFSRFPRLVRDLSRKSGKEVELITEGEETELDKSVVEAIGDPLVHLIRNAVDHGLESAEEREAAGKRHKGRIWLRASHEGNSVVIQVEDDGKGINPERIRDKAVEKGIISREEADKLEDRESVELIFAPGFSTAQDVTDVSGRGVGMDVVKNNIKSLNGNVTVQSELGKGSTFILSLPLTLAIIEALLVTIGEQTFAIPLDAVSEVTKISAEQITEINHRKAITLRGQVLGVVELAEVLGLPNGGSESDVLPLVIIAVNNKRLGLVVDTLLHRQEIVIKSLGEFLGELRGLSGATIMGDGSVITILDPNEIFSMTSLRG